MTATLAGCWTELVATAVLGTDRRPLPPAPPGPLGAFGRGRDPAIALLDRAAAAHAALRAAALPEPAGQRLHGSPEDPRVACPGPAAYRLGQMLDGRHADLVPEWLRTAVRVDVAAPPEHLVRLMDRTRSDPELRRLVVAAMGPVVGWLAALLPTLGWADAVPRDVLLAWEEGSAPERVEAFRLLRADDPGAARALLDAGLPGERADLRAACYAALRIGLTPADEPVLEWALDDRASAVRDVAAGLLARLPSSAWSGRMAERALEMVQVAGPPGADRLEIGLVAPVPPDWERDGIGGAAPPGSSLGVHVLHQIVAGTPLGAWSTLGPRSHLLVLAAEHELGPVLVAAWSAAASRQGDAAWASLLLAESGDPSLLAVVDVDERRAVATRSASAESVLSPLALTAFETIGLPWPRSLRRAVDEAVVALFAQRRAGRHQTPTLRRLARSLDPELLPRVADGLSALGLPPPTDGLRDDLVELLRFRAAMLRELEEIVDGGR